MLTLVFVCWRNSPLSVLCIRYFSNLFSSLTRSFVPLMVSRKSALNSWSTTRRVRNVSSLGECLLSQREVLSLKQKNVSFFAVCGDLASCLFLSQMWGGLRFLVCSVVSQRKCVREWGRGQTFCSLSVSELQVSICWTHLPDSVNLVKARLLADMGL